MERAAADLPREPSSLLSGRYVLGDVLGHGGMAVVYGCHDTELGVARAVKLLRPGHSDSVRRRLRAEASAMARLRHPNVLGIHDVGAEGSWDFVVMDLAEGGSLLERLEREGSLPVPEVAAYGVQLLSALAAAHAQGMVHRDVKPHNVLLDGAGRAMLADFGIALLLEDDRRTRTGVAMGSVAYMPPEQRLDASRVGPAADLYSVGATLFHLATGANPVDLFLAEDDRWEALPAELRPVLRRACAQHPEDRYPDAASMAADLRPLLPDDVTAFPSPSEGFSAQGATPLGPRRTPAREALALLYVPTADAVTPSPLAVQPDPAPPEHARWPGLVLATVAGLVVAGAVHTWRGDPEPVRMVVPMEVPAPEPVVAVVPPEPEVAPPPRPPPPVRPPLGRWRGSLNGVVLTLELRGTPDALTGAFTSSLAGRADRREVTGTFEPTSRRLVLEEVDQDRADAATYYLDLDPALARATGTARFLGGTRPLALTREGP